MKLGNAYLMGFPIHLKNPNYERAKFQFNFSLLISAEEYEKNFLIYELLLKKVAKTLEEIEIDAEYDFIKNNRVVINNFFDKLYEFLRDKQETIYINMDTQEFSKSKINFYFYFKFIDFSKVKAEIYPHKVPIWIKFIDDQDMLYFEASVKMVLEQIDGISYVKKIASKLDFELSYVIYIFYNLYISDCITFVDIFQYMNIYKATSNLRQLYNQPIYEEFKNFCCINLNLFDNKLKHRNVLKVYSEEFSENKILECDNSLDDNTLYSLYCELTNSNDVSHFIFKIKNFKINILLFVAFGIWKKIIRRIHIYGICKNKDSRENNFEYGSTE